MTGNTKKFILSNPGNVETVISSISLKGADQSAFSIQPASVTSIPAGGNIEITVSFSPSGPGTKNAELQIVPEKNNVETKVIALTGAYVPSSVEESPGLAMISHIADGIIIQMNVEKEMHYRIVDLSGKICASGDIDTRPFKLPLITRGLYLLQIISEDAMQVVPFIY